MRKKYLLIIASLIIALNTWAQGSSLSGTGSGTENDPYRIYNVYQLAQLSNYQGQSGVVFELMNNIDLSSFIQENNPTEGWDPVGTSETPFKGILKGKNHTISGLSINKSSLDNIGFFGYLDGATISNLTITGSSVKGQNNVGAFCGYAKGSTISNCSVTMTASVGVSGKSLVGGFAGGMEASTLTTCNSSSSVKGTSSNVGGFAGKATEICSLTGSTVTGNVTGVSYTGGAMGYYEGNLTNITVRGDVKGGDNTGGLVGCGEGTYKQITVQGAIQGTTNTGGIAGFIAGTINNATNEGNVTGNDNTGGIIGSGYKVTLTDVTAKGNVINASYSYIGGVAGKITGTCSFTRVSHTGDIKGKLYVSGGVGYISDGNASTFTDVHTRGTITNTGDYTGGVVAYAVNGGVGNMNNCSHFGDIIGANYVGGIIGQMNTGSAAPTISEYYLSTSSSTNTLYKGPYHDEIVAGTAKSYTINNCTAIGNIYGKNNVGGLIGWNINCVSAYSSSSKTISVPTGTSNSYCVWKDGIYTQRLSYHYSSIYYVELPIIQYTKNSVTFNISNNYYSGNVNGETNVGGLIGSQTSGSITNCYANGSVTGTSNVGGIIGIASGSKVETIEDRISLSSNVAIISSIKSGDTNAGRIYGALGNSYVTIGTLGTNNSNRALTTCNLVKNGVAQVVTTNSQNGNSTGQAMLRLKANYVSWGWDFDSDWSILETESYPYKKYQAAPPYLDQSLVSQATTIVGKSVNGGIVTMIYRDNAPVTYDCGTGHDFSFTTQPLQSGSQVQMFADVEGMVPSYYSTANVKFAGSGTEEDPYRIYTAEDLHLMPGAGYFRIMNDIDLAPWITANSPTAGWVPVGGNNSLPTYIDGNNCTISGLWTNSTSNYVGLFCNFLGGYIKDLTVKVASGKKVKGADYTGILIGNMSDGTITNCNIEGSVEGTAHVGGVIGNLSAGELSKNTVKATVTSSTASANVGGLAGSVSSVTSNDNNATVTITTTGNSSKVGGLFGRSSEGGIITKNKIDANITASGTENQVGGISGYTTRYISLCHVAGTVKCSGADSYVGGIAGYTTASIANCYTTAAITGTLYTAGIAGYTTSSINKCYMSGNIYGQRWAAGIVGYLDGANARVTNSTVVSNTLSVTHEQAWGCRIIGGFKNGAAEPDNSNYALNTMQVSINNVPKSVIDDQVEGIAKTEAELKSAALYTGLGWDMTSTWAINEGTAYPYLAWESTTTIPVTAISLNKATASINVGNTETLTATVTPSNATNKNIKWLSSNTNVATVADGVVTAIAPGTATITAKSMDGSNISATCNVTVTGQEAENPEVSQDNAMGMSAVSTSAGSQVELPITLTNSVDIIGYQFELKLPQGIKVAVDEDEDPIIAVGPRTTAKKHGFSTAFVDEQTLRVVCTSQSNAAFSGNDGVVCNVTLDVDESVINGNYTVELKNISLSDSQSNDITCGNVYGTLTVLNDYFTLSPVSGRSGKVFDLPVTMVNKSQIIGFQFEIELPDGISVATDEDDDYIITLGSRSTKHGFSTSKVNDNTVRFVCTSGTNAVFSGNDGVLCNVSLIPSKTIEAGTYDIKLKNISLSNTASRDISVADVATTVDISTFTPGDVNNDTKISVADVTATISFILGTQLPHFIKEAADMDGNGIVKVNDATAVTALVLNGGTSSAHAINPYASNTTHVESVIHIEPMAIAAGEEKLLQISLDNISDRVTGAQFDLCLPSGVSVVENEDIAEAFVTGRSNRHAVYSKEQQDGSYRFVIASMDNDIFAGTQGNILSVKIKASDAIAEGEMAIMAKNISLSNEKSGCIDLLDAISHISVGAATNIDIVNAGEDVNSIYTLNGVKQNVINHKGVYIVNGKKSIINKNKQ